MFHHDHGNYRVAVDETAKRFQDELHAKISASRDTAVALIDRIQREIPIDRIATSRASRSHLPAHVRLVARAGRGAHVRRQPAHGSP